MVKFRFLGKDFVTAAETGTQADDGQDLEAGLREVRRFLLRNI
jgi:hypothetical protein